MLERMENEDDLSSVADYLPLGGGSAPDSKNAFDRDDYDDLATALIPSLPSAPLFSEEKKHASQKKNRHSRALDETSEIVELQSSSHYQKLAANSPKKNDLPQHEALGEFDLRVIQHIRDATAPLSYWEHIAVLTAIASSVAAASTEHRFGDKTVEAIEKKLITIPEVVATVLGWIIAVPAASVQFAFSFGTAINFDIRLLRATVYELKHLLKYRSFSAEFKRDLPYLASSALFVVIPSAAGSVVMGYETYLTSPAWIRRLAMIGRLKAAIASNGSYNDSYEKEKLVDRNLDPRIKNNTFNNYALTQLIKDIRDKLRVLAQNFPLAYIEALNKGLFNSLQKPTSFATKVKIMLELHRTLHELDQTIFVKSEEPLWIQRLSLFLGFSTSLMNLMAATKAAELFGMPIVNSDPTLIEFLSDLSHLNWNWKLIFSFWIIGMYCGYGASKTNTLINRDGTKRLLGKMSRTYQEGWTAHFAEYTRLDLLRLRIICMGSAFYAAAKFGSAIGYPLLPFDVVAYPEATFMDIVFTGVAYMSFDNFLNKVNHRWHRYLFTSFINALDKLAYYNNLSEDDQWKLVDLIDIFLNDSLGKIIDLVNVHTEQFTNHSLPEDIVAELTRRFPKPNQAKPAEQKVNEIAIEPDLDDDAPALEDEHYQVPDNQDNKQKAPADEKDNSSNKKGDDASPMLRSLHKHHLSRHSGQLYLPPPTTSPVLTPAKGAPPFFNEPIYRSSATKRMLKEASAAVHAHQNLQQASSRNPLHDVEAGVNSVSLSQEPGNSAVNNPLKLRYK